jgi:protein phosphatase
MRDTASFDRLDGYPDTDDDTGGPDTRDRARRGGGHRAGRRGYDEDDNYGPRGKRRWPIVTTALVLLVLLVGGGGYGFWRYNQSQYYVGLSNGYVAIFRGTDQSMAGINLSSLVTRSTLQASTLRSSDQAGLAQTIAQGSQSSATLLIDQLQGEADRCQQEWQALAAWQVKNLQYQAAVAKAAKAKAKTRPKDTVGPMPTAPNAADCAASTAFGIPGSALPSQTSTTSPTPAPSASSSAKPSAKPSASKSASA